MACRSPVADRQIHAALAFHQGPRAAEAPRKENRTQTHESARQGHTRDDTTGRHLECLECILLAVMSILWSCSVAISSCLPAAFPVVVNDERLHD